MDVVDVIAEKVWL